VKYLENVTPNINCEDCTWHDLKNCKNITQWEDWSDAEDCKFAWYFLDIKDSYDINFQAYETSLVYESLWFEKVNSSMWIFLSVGLNNVYYSQYCFNCSNLFWCAGLSNKEYCILNKQYSKEEYFEIVPRIIKSMMTPHLSSPKPRGGDEVGGVDEVGGANEVGRVIEWWEFFPASISPFWYNETAAFDYLPLSKEKALELGFNWSDYETPHPEVSKIIPALKLPKNIKEVPDDILNWAIECEVTWKPFRIIKQELEFYRQHNLPIPTKHHDIRHLERIKLS
jgi:hypothetical protein